MATNIRFVANYGADTVAVKAASNGAVYTTSSSSLPNYTRLQDGSSTNLAGVDASGYLSSWSMGYCLSGSYIYPRTIELDNGSVGAFMGRVMVNIAAQNLTALKVSRTSSANGPSNPFYNAILGANGSSIVSAANPLPTTATITGDVNVDVNSANGTCLIGKTSGGDFTTTYTSATTITIGTVPYSHTFTAEDIVSIIQIASDGSVTNTYTRDDKAMSISGSIITVTGATFSATDKFIIFSCIPRRIYIDQTTPGTTNNVSVTTMKPDGTNTMPSLDAVGRAGFIKITDGTETANVNASNQLEVAEANSATIAGDTTSIDGKITACNTGAVVVSSGAITETNSGIIAGDTTSIDGKITACNTGAIAGTVTANAGTNLNTSTLAIESGGNLATIAGDTTSIDGKITACNTGAVTISSALPAGTNLIGKTDLNETIGTISTNNSTTSNLGIDAIFTGTADDIKNYAAINVSIFTDKASATDGLSLEWSQDGTNWDEKMTVSIGASKVESYEFGVRARYFRIVYTNGGVAQTTFRLQVMFHPTRTRQGARCLCVDIDPREFAATRRAIIAAKKPSGDYTNVHATAGGNLKTSIEEFAGSLPAGTNLMGKIGIDQTTPGTTNNVYVTTMKPDGTNTMPSLDAVGRAGFLKITDGIETANVNASNQLETAEANSATIAGDTTSIDGKITACNTGAIAGTVTANAGTNLNTSTLAIESGGNLATIAGDTTSIDGKITACNTGAVAGTVTANAGTNLNTSTLAIESGGNLATIAGDTTSMDGKITACNTGAVVVSSGAITETNSGAIKTSVQLIDDAIAAEGAAATKGMQISLDDGTDTQFAQCDASGYLKTTAQFSGDVYVKTMTMAADAATRFETTALKLRDYVIKVLTHNALLGDNSSQTFPFDIGEVLGGTLIDLQDLYFKNATAGQNMVIHIIGTKV